MFTLMGDKTQAAEYKKLHDEWNERELRWAKRRMAMTYAMNCTSNMGVLFLNESITLDEIADLYQERYEACNKFLADTFGGDATDADKKFMEEMRQHGVSIVNQIRESKRPSNTTTVWQRFANFLKSQTKPQ